MKVNYGEVMNPKARFFNILGRIFLILAVLSLILGWTCNMNSGLMSGISSGPFYISALVLGLLGIASFIIKSLYS